ncbi:hypothetical protein J7F03_23260 [Streptomyces sp. ISL-43]|uniref:hypothetical protein n=1 Tax=Streptomyces sp. ISL-43 TaxID=2819183 RepID=UPI001BE4FD0C|nr:hypothetical protein [Streptomyces sp. ISL-43]MBT2449938.1 hypothetical protein [Streptomyces sp. ISL-43]
MKPVNRIVPVRVKGTVISAWREPVSRAYLGLFAVFALWAAAGGTGLVAEWWPARHLAVILSMPWLLVVVLFLALARIDSWLLGYNFYFESPAWLFEPLWVVYCLAAGLLNARLLARWSRSARESGRTPWVVPVSAVAFFAAVFALWHL